MLAKASGWASCSKYQNPSRRQVEQCDGNAREEHELFLREGHCPREPGHCFAVAAELQDPHDAEELEHTQGPEVHAPQREIEGKDGCQVQDSGIM